MIVFIGSHVCDVCLNSNSYMHLMYDFDANDIQTTTAMSKTKAKCFNYCSENWHFL